MNADGYTPKAHYEREQRAQRRGRGINPIRRSIGMQRMCEVMGTENYLHPQSR